MAMTLTVDQSGFHLNGKSMKPTKEKNALLDPYGKMLHLYGVVLELLPDPKQEQLLKQTCGCARLVHNDYISMHGDVYRNEKRTLSLSEYKKTRLSALKSEKTFLRDVDKFALEAAAEHAEAAFQNFFAKRAKYPRFVTRRKPNGNRYTTKKTNGNIAVCTADGIPCVRLPKVNKVPFILPAGKTVTDVMPDEARITKATVSLKNGRWFVSLAVESIIDLVTPAKTVSVREIMAGDAGLKEFLVYGTIQDTVHVENPGWIRLHERRLRRFQKMLSRRQYDKETHTGSKNWEKARALVAKEQAKCADQRKDFQHKLSRIIADSCTVFVCEDLNIKGMMKNRHLSKAIASVGWYGFFQKLRYKLEKKGGMVLKAGRFFASSQICSGCGYQNPEVKDLRIRSWVCPECGMVHDRDGNAKENLLYEGIRLLTESGVRVTDTNLLSHPV